MVARARPILFSAPMVRALLAGRKTQTRRTVKITHRTPGLASALEPPHGIRPYPRAAAELCPYGRPGDLLWVRETFQPLFADRFDHSSCPVPDWKSGYGYAPRYMATEDAIEWIDGDDNITDRCSPSIHMPRWASRITLRITEVRVERLQDISEADAIAEGLRAYPCADGHCYAIDDDKPGWTDPRFTYQVLWTSINGTGSWAENPWVWVVCFEVISTNVDQVMA